jgi:hypothetical protein
MRLVLLCTFASVLSVLALACSKTPETEREKPDTAATEVSAPDVAAPQPEGPDVGGAEDTYPEPVAQDVIPAEALPSSEHGGGRLELGIDGDPGYTQTELTPEELAKVRAEAAASPEPSYPEEPNEPSPDSDPDEASAETGAGGSGYYYRMRDPLYLERERLRREQLEEPTPHERAGESELPRGGGRR